MIDLKDFIFLEAQHLPHPEDEVVKGKRGFRQAFGVLHQLHKYLSGKPSNVTLSQKYDGSPAVVFDKDSVATKSAFNKTPKINRTHMDIRRNHPNSPGLRAKLHMALATLPKVAPRTGTYQGDIMYTRPDVKRHGERLEVTPNTITYGASRSSPEGKRMDVARIGVVPHTRLVGQGASMRSEPLADLSGFGSSPDVHLINPSVSRHADYTPVRQARARRWLGGAVAAHRKIDYKAIKGHEAQLQMYINQTVRDNTRPTAKGYYKHLAARAAVNKDVKPEHLEAVRRNPGNFDNVFHAQRYLELAKTAMIHAIDPHNHQFSTSIGGRPSGPEGYVVGGTAKIVKRRPDVHGPGFSAANFAKPGLKEQKEEKRLDKFKDHEKKSNRKKFAEKMRAWRKNNVKPNDEDV